MQRIIDYAFGRNKMLKGEDGFSAWEDLLWDPAELRQAIIEAPEQSTTNLSYKYKSSRSIGDFTGWRIVNPFDISKQLELKAREAEGEAKVARSPL